jgi:hypothetical protein
MRRLIICLLCLAGCGGASDPAPAQSAPMQSAPMQSAPMQSASGQSMSWDFESGTFPPAGPPTPTQFPTVVLLEGSPHFHYGRLTAVPADCGPSFFTDCPKTRAEVFVNSLIPVAGQFWTYQFDLRMPSSGAAGNNTGAHTLMACQVHFTTPPNRSIWIGVTNGRWYIANRIQPCPAECITDPLDGGTNPAQVIDLGAVVYDEWETFRVVVRLETDTTGTVQVSKNGITVGTMTNQATFVAIEPQEIYMNMLDVNGSLGIVDFDNLSMSTVQPPP